MKFYVCKATRKVKGRQKTVTEYLSGDDLVRLFVAEQLELGATKVEVKAISQATYVKATPPDA